jgi:ribosomal protein S18 acetylase RimI-like enzyme
MMIRAAHAADGEELPQTGAVYALSIATSHQGQGLGRRLALAVAADLAQRCAGS